MLHRRSPFRTVWSRPLCLVFVRVEPERHRRDFRHRRISQGRHRGATVTITNADTGVIAWTGKTNVDGVYRAPNLPAGSYNIDVTASGFKHQQVSGIELSVGQRANVTFHGSWAKLPRPSPWKGRRRACWRLTVHRSAAPSRPRIAGLASAQPQYPEPAGADAGRFLRRRRYQPGRPQFFAAFHQWQPDAE